MPGGHLPLYGTAKGFRTRKQLTQARQPVGDSTGGRVRVCETVILGAARHRARAWPNCWKSKGCIVCSILITCKRFCGFPTKTPSVASPMECLSLHTQYKHILSQHCLRGVLATIALFCGGRQPRTGDTCSLHVSASVCMLSCP